MRSVVVRLWTMGMGSWWDDSDGGDENEQVK